MIFKTRFYNFINFIDFIAYYPPPPPAYIFMTLKYVINIMLSFAGKFEICLINRAISRFILNINGFFILSLNFFFIFFFRFHIYQRKLDSNNAVARKHTKKHKNRKNAHTKK